MIPVPRFTCPRIVESFHKLPSGPATPSVFSVLAIVRGLMPDANSLKIRSATTACASSISRSRITTDANWRFRQHDVELLALSILQERLDAWSQDHAGA